MSKQTNANGTSIKTRTRAMTRSIPNDRPNQLMTNNLAQHNANTKLPLPLKLGRSTVEETDLLLNSDIFVPDHRVRNVIKQFRDVLSGKIPTAGTKRHIQTSRSDYHTHIDYRVEGFMFYDSLVFLLVIIHNYMVLNAGKLFKGKRTTESTPNCFGFREFFDSAKFVHDYQVDTEIVENILELGKRQLKKTVEMNLIPKLTAFLELCARTNLERILREQVQMIVMFDTFREMRTICNDAESTRFPFFFSPFVGNRARTIYKMKGDTFAFIEDLRAPDTNHFGTITFTEYHQEGPNQQRVITSHTIVPSMTLTYTSDSRDRCERDDEYRALTCMISPIQCYIALLSNYEFDVSSTTNGLLMSYFYSTAYRELLSLQLLGFGQPNHGSTTTLAPFQLRNRSIGDNDLDSFVIEDGVPVILVTREEMKFRPLTRFMLESHLQNSGRQLDGRELQFTKWTKLRSSDTKATFDYVKWIVTMFEGSHLLMNRKQSTERFIQAITKPGTITELYYRCKSMKTDKDSKIDASIVMHAAYYAF